MISVVWICSITSTDVKGEAHCKWEDNVDWGRQLEEFRPPALLFYLVCVDKPKSIEEQSI